MDIKENFISSSKNEILLLLIGWFLGLFAPIIVDLIKNKRDTKVIKRALFSELRELQFRLVLVVYKVESNYGNLNKEFFKWTQSILTGYKGVNSTDSLIKAVESLSNLTNEEIQIANKKNLNNSGLELKKFTLSVLDSNLALLSRFNSPLQVNLLEIKTHLGFVNEIVDDARYYFRLSFENNISTKNYETANHNMINSYKNYAVQARIIIDLINKIIAKNKV
jgi:hypothetical protein